MLFFSKADANGRLYCVRFDRVDHGDALPCASCEYLRGAMQGAGRECEVGEDDKIVDIQDPYEYMDSKRLPEDAGEGL
jgi:hypothetical protein